MIYPLDPGCFFQVFKGSHIDGDLDTKRKTKPLSEPGGIAMWKDCRWTKTDVICYLGSSQFVEPANVWITPFLEHMPLSALSLPYSDYQDYQVLWQSSIGCTCEATVTAGGYLSSLRVELTMRFHNSDDSVKNNVLNNAQIEWWTTSGWRHGDYRGNIDAIVNHFHHFSIAT